MGQENISAGHATSHQIQPQIAKPGAGIKNQNVIPGAYFNATGIAAILNMIGRRAGNAAPDTPEFNVNCHRHRDPVSPVTINIVLFRAAMPALGRF
jgi:hypothetical protein